MEKISFFILTFLLNALWQAAAITFVAAICLRLMSRISAQRRHRVWTAALLLSVALPVWSSFDFGGDSAALRILPIRERRIETQAITTAVSENIVVLDNFSPRRETFAESNRVPLFVRFIAGCYVLFLLYRVILLCAAWRRTIKIRRSAVSRALPRYVGAIVAQCQMKLQTSKIEILFSPEIKSPVMSGWRNPAVILPETFFDGCSDEMLTATFGHEMAHVKRRDYALNFICELVFLSVAFHPAAAHLKRQIARTREMACDELVGERLLEPKVYAKSLLRLAAFVKNANDSAHALGVFDANILEQRIVKLIEMNRRGGTRAGKFAFYTALLLLVATGAAASAFSFSSHDSEEYSVADILAQDGGDVQTTIAKKINALDSANPVERAKAAGALGKMRAVSAIPFLIRMLGDDTTIEPLGTWDWNSSWSPALRSFKNPSPGEEAALALAAMGKPALEPLVAALADANPDVRRNAAWAIGEIRGGHIVNRQNAVEPLIAALGDEEAWTRKAAAFSLGEIRNTQAVEPLIETLKDASAEVRETAASSLGEIKDERATDALTVVANDADGRVRKEAKSALEEIQGL